MDNVKIYDTLKMLAISPACKGYEYITVAMDLIEADVHIPRCKLYKEIAKICNTTNYRVERCIRHIVSRGITFGNMDKWEEIFGYNISPNSGSLTNGDFLWGLYRCLEVQK